MKKNNSILFLAALMFLQVFSTGSANAQGLKSFKLTNGMTVFVWEDPAKSDVFGEVVVRSGSINDPEQYTGLAHYLEHMMFKGTDKIGALDWEKEKPLYEQIIAKYDEMAVTTDQARRDQINKEINELAIEESKYCKSQEYSDLIQYLGGNSLNAGTSYDQTVYYNSFPPNQIQKWLFLASERFLNPVFRNFQSELETVYEEYNLYADMSSYQEQRFLFEKLFEGSPYARDVIGLPEHLKSPRLSELIKFYDTWYVPGNMALILVGNVNTKAIMRTVNATFGRLPQKAVPEHTKYPGFDVKGRKQYDTKLGDYPSVYMAYEGVMSGDPDEPALELCLSLLNNDIGSGLLDKLATDGDLMGVAAELVPLNGIGRCLIAGIPYYDNAQQSYDSNKNVEKMLTAAIKKLSKGDFEDEALENLKVALKRDFDLMMEGNDGKMSLIAQAYSAGTDIGEALNYKARLDAVTREDVIRVANRYLSSNYIVIHNESGKASKGNKIKKPEIKPVESPAGVSSAYAQQFKAMAAPTPIPSFTDWSQVEKRQINSHSQFYYTTNEENNVFTLTLKYGANSKLFPKLEYAAGLMGTAGIMAQYSSHELKDEFARLGATCNIRTNSEYLTITLRGYEENLREACTLLTRLVLMPELDEKQLNNLKGVYISSRLTRKDDINSQGEALEEYIQYGEESEYRKELSDKELLDLGISELTGAFVNATHYAAQIHYSGTLPMDTVYPILCNSLPLIEGEQPSSSPWIREMRNYDQNTVYFLPNTESQQAQIYFYIPMGDYDKSEEVSRMAFNQYFSGGFNGLVMNEIREKNSMAYTTYGYADTRKLPGSKTYFTGYIGTQNDKANDAIDLYMSLLRDMPRNEESINNIKIYLRETLMSNRPDKRDQSLAIANWELQGYTDDPAREQIELIDNLSFDSIVSFYEKYLQGKPVVIGIIGNPKDVDTKRLEAIGKLVRIRDKNLYNEEDVLFQ